MGRRAGTAPSPVKDHYLRKNENQGEVFPVHFSSEHLDGTTSLSPFILSRTKSPIPSNQQHLPVPSPSPLAQATPPPGRHFHRRRRSQSSLSPSKQHFTMRGNTPKPRVKGPETDDLLSSTWFPPPRSYHSNMTPNHTYHKLASRILGKGTTPLETGTKAMKQTSNLHQKTGLVEREVQRLRGNKACLHLQPASVLKKAGPLSPGDRQSIK